METAFVITPHVINTLNALPEQERVAVASALAVELLLGTQCNGGLTDPKSTRLNSSHWS